MDLALKSDRERTRHALLLVALAPVIPQLLGSVFNVWYNAVVIDPLLDHGTLGVRFFQTVIFYNIVAYPIGVGLWLWKVLSLGSIFERLRAALSVAEEQLPKARRLLIHLPWWAAAISAAGWLFGAPVFLASLGQVQSPLDPLLLWHLPISFCLSGFIAITNTFFLVELATHSGLFPFFFRDARADLTSGTVTLSLRGRGLLWAISAAVCPIISLILLAFAPIPAGNDLRWFAVFVGSVGILFGLGTALMMSRLVAKPIDQLRAAAQAVGAGRLDLQIPLTRADEFGVLIAEFNYMMRELKDKERLRQTFGLHVGEQAAEQILARDPGLGGIEQEITVMFVDVRSFTSRAGKHAPQETLEVLNEFLRVTVRVVEEEHGGMINKYLGDGFMALFGIGGEAARSHAQDALNAGRGILRADVQLNRDFVAQGRAPQIGIGINSGPAIVGGIGSPQRLEFTAIGPTVNLGSRIESLTKQAGASLLVTAATRDRLPDPANLIELPPQQVRGVDQPVRIFALREGWLAARPRGLSSGMATEMEAINAEELRARVGELRRFL